LTPKSKLFCTAFLLEVKNFHQSFHCVAEIPQLQM
jgi:hypothetical protein